MAAPAALLSVACGRVLRDSSYMCKEKVKEGVVLTLLAASFGIVATRASFSMACRKAPSAWHSQAGLAVQQGVTHVNEHALYAHMACQCSSGFVPLREASLQVSKG